MARKNKYSIDYSPSEERKIKNEKNAVFDQNMNAASLFWCVIGVLFLLVAVIVTIVGSQFVDIESLTSIKEAVLSRQVNETGGTQEFWSVFVFTISGAAVVASSITVIMSIVFGIRGALFIPHKKVWGIVGAITSGLLFLLINVPLLQFSMSYIITVFA